VALGTALVTTPPQDAGRTPVRPLVSELRTVERVEIFPFHRLGFDKYERLGMQPPLAGVEPPDDALIDRVRAQFGRRGVVVAR
jgi:pyruvate formate lyase activating enzyme